MRVNNLNDSLNVRRDRKIKKLSKRAPLEHSAINQGRTRWIGGELVGEAGAQQTWHGNALFDGNVQITLSLQVEGDTVIGGSVQITEDLDVSAETVLRGLTTLLNDLVVFGDGRIQVGSSMTLDPAESNGAIKFSNGAQVFTDEETIQVYKGNGVVQISDDYARLQFGGSSVVVDGEGIHFYGAIFAHNLPTVTDDANAAVDPDTGRLGITDD